LLPRTDDPQAAARCYLLELPAELRNPIYEYVIFDRYVKYLKQDNCSEPALLQACKKMRNEALSMYRHRMKFELQLQDFQFGPQLGHWFWQPLKQDRFVLENEGRCDWRDFLEWLKMCHRGVIGIPEVYQDSHRSDGTAEIFDLAFKIANNLKETPWLTVKDVLNFYAAGVVQGQNTNDLWVISGGWVKVLLSIRSTVV
jgi:hypothetical protein